MLSTRTSFTYLALSLLLSCEVQSVSQKPAPAPADPTPPRPTSLTIFPTKVEPPKPQPLPKLLSPYLGKETAKITLVAFIDYQCPYCNRAEATIKELKTQYGDDLRIVWKDLPLISHNAAKPAAIAARAAGKQGNDKFLAMHDLLFTIQSSLPLTTSLFEPYAATIKGLDLEQWKKDVADPSTAALVETDLALAASVGTTSTPTFYINGEILTGSQPIATFQEVFNRQKARAENLLAAGTTPENLYQELISIGLPTAPKGSKLPAGLIYKIPVESTAPQVIPIQPSR
jgi:protein-disulfide isomerase